MEYVYHQNQIDPQMQLLKEKAPQVALSPRAQSFTPVGLELPPSPSAYRKTAGKNEPLNAPKEYVKSYSYPSSHHSDPPPMIDFARFLARRELITTGLFKFDDNPENFRAWQSSFLNATEEIGLSYSEELDLLVKWLGKESSEHVKRIRAVYATNPKAALQLSWERLQECYATPEVVENALFKK